MKSLILLFIACFFAVNAFAIEKVTDKNLLKKLTEELTKSGKSCSSIIDAYILSKDSEAIVYKVVCRDRANPYTVTLNPTGEPNKTENFLDKLKKNTPGSF
jgi:hypothetical protein